MRGQNDSRTSRRLGTALCAAIAVAIILTVGGCFLLPNTLPVAEVEADPTEGIAPLTVEFDGTDSYDPDGEIRRYEWDFGDGDEGTGSQVDHTYSAAGTYDAALTVVDGRGGRATASVGIHVRGSNELPVAALSVYRSPAYPGQSIQFSAAASYDPDGNIVSYEWNYGDGAAGSGVSAYHKYSTVGAYDVLLTVRDNDGGVRTATAQVEISTNITTSGTVSRHYEWEYDGQNESCDLDISLDLYRYYKSQVRVAFARMTRPRLTVHFSS